MDEEGRKEQGIQTEKNTYQNEVKPTNKQK